MSQSPSDTEAAASGASEAAEDPLTEFADGVAEVVGGEARAGFGTVKVKVPADNWSEAHLAARDQLDLVFFSWLSAIDWANEVEVGDPPGEQVEERIELLSALSDLTDGNLVVLSTDLPSDGPSIRSLVDVFAGANWHEREAHEMFGIEFEGHPNLDRMYLPDSFIGNPMRKSYPLLSREVKPWPGTVDVEAMPDQNGGDEPSTENPGS